jgi:hypothetical protein
LAHLGGKEDFEEAAMLLRHGGTTKTVVRTEQRDGRPHLFALAFGALDAHVNKIDYFDTVGGEELIRLYRRRRALRQRSDAPTSA